jgi:hypothetical protein
VRSDCRLTCSIIAYELHISKETVRKNFSTASWHEKSAAKLDGGTTLWNNFNKILFIVSLLMMKHAVINMIPRPNANPWSVFLLEYKTSIHPVSQQKKWT